MKKILLFTAVFFLSFCLNAQINVGPKEAKKMKGGSFEKEDLDMLKATTTIFVYDDKDEDRLEEIEEAINEAWTFTDIEIVKGKDLQKYSNKKNYSYFTVIKDVTTTVNSKTGFTTTYIHYYLSLWMNKEGKKDKQIRFGRIELYPTFASISTQNPSFYNWNTGFVKGYLSIFNNYLLQGKTRWLFQEEENIAAISSLKNDTLYIPDYVFIKFNKFTGDESKTFDHSDILKSYPYPYKIISADKLSNKILNSPKPVNYLVYTKSSTDKYITVYNTKSGMIYSKYKGVSYNIKSKDLGAIATKISKAKS